MKVRTLLSLSIVVALTALFGCGSPKAPVENAPPSADATTETDDTEASSDEAADDETDPLGMVDDKNSADLSRADLPEAGETDDLQDDAVTDEEADSELAMEEFKRKLTQALQIDDIGLAMQLIETQIEAFPDDLGLKVNQVAMRVRFDGELAGDDYQAAATRFLKTAELVQELEPFRAQLPPQLDQLFLGASINEARAFALQENVAKATELVVASVKSGMGDLGWIQEDPFFAKIRDNDQFRKTLDGIWSQIAQEELGEFESFPFDFELPNLDQETVKLAALKGKLVIVDVWGTWCPPCRQEIPHFVKLQDQHRDDLAIIGINYENGEGEEMIAKIREFATEQSMNYTCVIGDEATREQIPDFEGFPTTLFLDRTGKVRLKVVGYHSYEKLEAYVNALLGEDAAG